LACLLIGRIEGTHSDNVVALRILEATFPTLVVIGDHDRVRTATVAHVPETNRMTKLMNDDTHCINRFVIVRVVAIDPHPRWKIPITVPGIAVIFINLSTPGKVAVVLNVNTNLVVVRGWLQVDVRAST